MFTINSRNNDKFQDGDNKLITYLKWLSIVLLSFYVIIILFPSNKINPICFFLFGFNGDLVYDGYKNAYEILQLY